MATLQNIILENTGHDSITSSFFLMVGIGGELVLVSWWVYKQLNQLSVN